jgi:hypothetical protein
MDPQRFDAFTRAVTSRVPTRRSLFQGIVAGTAAVAAGMVAGADAGKKGKKKKCKGGCDANQVCKKGKCKTAPNRCSGPTGICDDDPTPCGTSAEGDICGCERTVEGNNACINAGDNVCTDVECTSTQDCEEALGFHFFCQQAKRNAAGQFCGCGFGTATGKVCVPECDNPS